MRRQDPNSALILRILLSSALLLCLAGLLAPAHAQGWELQPSAVTEALYGLDITPSGAGVCVGEQGVVLQSDDGGLTWLPIPSPTIEPLLDVEISDFDENLIFAVGGQGSVFSSFDGGSIWQAVYSDPLNSLRGVEIADATVVFAVGAGPLGGVILRSEDGGVIWVDLPVPPTTPAAQPLISVAFADADVGLAVGFGGVILRTDTGGDVWEQVTSSTGQPLYDVTFLDPLTALVVGQGGTLLRTDDGGLSWQPVDTGSSNVLQGIAFDDALNGTIVGLNSTILRTQDGGVSWTPEPGATGGVTAVSPTYLPEITVAVGSSGSIYLRHPSATYVVTNTGDSGAGSLRQAILDANAHLGFDSIEFAIPGVGPHTIQPLSNLPHISDPVIVDAYTQPGASPNTNGPGLGSNAVLMVELDGTNAGITVGLRITGDGSTVQGLVINRFESNGIVISTGAGNIIRGNFIGTDLTGSTALGNANNGVTIRLGATNNTIGGTEAGARNVISGNTNNGIGIVEDGTTGNQVQGNFIGVDVTGTVAVGNLVGGVAIESAPGNTIGGTTAAARNIISGNAGQGVSINGDLATVNFVQGNYVGTDVTGTLLVGNVHDGVAIGETASGNTVGGTTAGAGNVISGNRSGVILGSSAYDNFVQGNLIGTDMNGISALGNTEYGVGIRTGAANNTIGHTTSAGRNVIAANGLDGILILDGTTTSNVVQGNYIGTDLTGSTALGNALNGVAIILGATNNTIGGTAAGARNVISGNTGSGISIRNGSTTGNQVQGNFIGVDFNGTAALGNLVAGVAIGSAPGNIIGGTTAAARNIISGNASWGVAINNDLATGNSVQGNYIGTDFTGTAVVGNGIAGIAIGSSASDNTVGGTAVGAGNLISGNQDGVVFGSDAHDNFVRGNLIGTDVNGVSALSNTRNGVVIRTDAANNTIGGATTESGNAIAFNGVDGLEITSGTGNAVLSNSIFSNAGLGIDLGPDGVTANDVGDGDTGANNLQNYPVLTSVSEGDSIQGTLNSTPSTTFTLHFYLNDDCDPSGNGEGATFIESWNDVVTDASGNAFFVGPPPPLGSEGQFVTATATDPLGNTSEFSLCAEVVAPAYVVTNTNDSGAGSLRQAIVDANANVGFDSIEFAIPGTGPHTITPQSQLPSITDPVLIDGYTQPGSSPNTNPPDQGTNAVLMIELDGSAASPAFGLDITGSSSTARGLAINRFVGGASAGVRFGDPGSDNTLEGCFIGTNADGSVALPNQYGVRVIGSPYNTIGGDAPAARNLISGQLNNAITLVSPGSTGNVVQGNLVGTNASGLAATPNEAVTIAIGVDATSTRVGGATASTRNVVSGNLSNAISCLADSCVIQGNYIGVDVTGYGALANDRHGIVIANAAAVQIGGPDAGMGNVISNNGIGIDIEGAGSHDITIQRNFIGTGADGVVPMGNRSDGILLLNGPSYVTIGGSVDSGNVITLSGLAGVDLGTTAGVGNRIVGNSIHSNVGQGIDLGDQYAVQPNDPGDTDVGSNNYQNYPLLSTASSDGITTTVSGTINTTPLTDITIELFGNEAGCDALGYGEGQTHLDQISVTTDGAGDANFTFVLGTGLTEGYVLTATATDPDGNTSEFSACFPVSTPEGERDLTIENLSHSPINPISTDAIDFQAVMRNTGAAPVPASYANLTLADEVAGVDFWVPNELWTEQFGGSGYDRASDVAANDSGVFMAGRFTFDLDGQTRVGADDGYVRHVDLDGNWVWTRYIGTTDRDEAFAVDVDDDAVYVAGYTQGTLPTQTPVGGADAFLIKYDLVGNVLWTRQFGTAADDSARAVHVDATGIYVAGVTTGSFAGYSNAGDHDAFVRKYDLDGNILWTDQYGSPAYDLALDVTSYGSYVYVVGSAAAALPGVTHIGDEDSHLRRYDLAGNVLWTRRFGTVYRDQAIAVVADASGVYVAGGVVGDWAGQTSSGGQDFYIRKSAPSGLRVWTILFGSDQLDEIRGLVIAADGLYFTGRTQGVLPGETSAGQTDVLFGKADLDGNLIFARQLGSGANDVGFRITAHDSGVYVAGEASGALPDQTHLGNEDALILKTEDFLQPGETWAIGRQATFPAGSYDYYAGADVTDIVAETDEFNNTASASFVVTAVDSDGDGVLDDVDACPAEDASMFDRDGDGCIDPIVSSRHIEYWGQVDFPLEYSIHEGGVPGITDDSDLTVLQASMDAWTSIPGVEASATYLGTTTEKVADALDGNNVITAADTRTFPSGVIALGITTSFTVPTDFDGRLIRPGQIVDSDMIINPAKRFRTATSGPADGVDLLSLGTHEAGHMFGLAHSAVIPSTMFYVLPPDVDGASLEIEDNTAMLAAYPDAVALASETHVSGTVRDGRSDEPIPGAGVFAMDPAGNMLACTFTLPTDGSFEFLGLPAGDYKFWIHALDQSSAVGGIAPGNVNTWLGSTAVTLLVPEFYDAAESKNDDPAAFELVTLSPGIEVTGIDIVTNIDETGPAVVSTVPGPNEVDVPIGSAILVDFTEALDLTSISAQTFRLENQTTLTGVAGSATLVNDKTDLMFVPNGPLDFATDYLLTLGSGLTDVFGNLMGVDYTTSFTTENLPDVHVSSLAPSKGVAGAMVVINGFGFDGAIAGNEVSFDGTVVGIDSASPTKLVVHAPEDASTGSLNVVVRNIGSATVSTPVSFTILSSEEFARGFDIASVDLGALPRAVSVSPNGTHAFIATDTGVSAVVVDPGRADFKSRIDLLVQGGTHDVDVTPDGSTAYAVGTFEKKLLRIDIDPSTGAITVLSDQTLAVEPRGILIEPSGSRGFIANDTDELLIWDTRQGSGTIDRQLGTLECPDGNLNLLGKMATDPTGDFLYALAGTGEILVFDLSTNSFLQSVGVGPDPRDITVDPAGQYIYVSDNNGFVTVFNATTLSKITDVTTGGTPRSLSVTPAGSYLYNVNRELNLLDVIDLRVGETTHRSVIANIPLAVNPVDGDLSPDGYYAYAISELDRKLTITAVGLGPAIATQSIPAGPDGAKLVLSGLDLDSDATTMVSFDGAMVAPDALTSTSLTVSLPAGMVDGPVRVVGSNPSEPDKVSNPIFLEHLDPTTGGALRLSFSTGGAPDPATVNCGSILAMSPLGELLALTDLDGGLHLLDTDPDLESFGQYIGSTVLGAVGGDLVVTPDAGRVYVLQPSTNSIQVVDTNRRSTGFLGEIATIDFGPVGGAISHLSLSPDGAMLVVSNGGLSQIHLVDAVAGSPTEHEIVASIDADGPNITGIVGEMAFHPGGTYIYLPVLDPDPSVIQVVDVATRIVATTLVLPAAVPQPLPSALAFTPDGERCLVLASPGVGGTRSVVILDSTVPENPTIVNIVDLGVTAPPAEDDIDVSPRGDRVIVSIGENGLHNYALTPSLDDLIPIGTITDVARFAGEVENAYSPDAAYFFSLSEASEDLLVYDFTDAQSLTLLAGDGQTGVVSTALTTPLSVQVTAGGSAAGVAVTFTVTAGGGSLGSSGLTTRTVTANDAGEASVSFVLGPALGIQSVEATASVPIGSPVLFTATALESPDNLPLAISDIAPEDGLGGVSITTAIQANLSRAVDPATVIAATFNLSDAATGTVVPSVIGLANGNRSISLTPQALLTYGTQYIVTITDGITDTDGGALQIVSPFTSDFTTSAPPPPTLTSISPPSATPHVGVVLAGSGFDLVAQNNLVTFNGTPATITAGSADYLNVVVPPEATSGPVQVTAGGQSSETLEFTVLEATTSPADDVVDTAKTGSSTRSVAVSPDGAVAYAVSPDANSVVAIDLESLEQIATIGVGENPFAIVIHPDGNFVYVTNLLSNSLSIIDSDPNSPDYNEVDETLIVGDTPIDVAVSPDGDRVYVANLGSSEISVIDGDELSETHNSVVESSQQGATTRSVAVSPDGTRLYVGTDDGYIVLDSLSYGVIASAKTGSGTRSIAVSPDGSLIVLLTTEGAVLIVDVAPNSITENEVVASAGGGATTRSIAISPDGAYLYLVLEESDLVLVVSLDLGTGISVIDPDAALAPLELTVVATIEVGEDPAAIAFDPSGSGKVIVTNAGDNTISILGSFVFAVGSVTADCPESGTPLYGVEIDAFSSGTGDLSEFVVTDENGDYTMELSPGVYTFTVVTPLGYTIENEEVVVDVVGSESNPTRVDFSLSCEDIPPSPRKMSFWKHQLGLALLGKGQPEVDGPTLCGYLNMIEAHFYSHRVNAVEVYEPPASGQCSDKLQVAKDLLNLKGTMTDLAQAKQELLALLFNVASQKLALSEVISLDGASVSEAITYVDRLIDDDDAGNDKIARNVAKDINKGKVVDLGVIPDDVPDIAYSPGRPTQFSLSQNFPNPFNPTTMIRFALPTRERVRLAIYDTAGRRVRVLINEEMLPAVHEILWDGRSERGHSVASGVYFYRIEAGTFSESRKMLLLK